MGNVRFATIEDHLGPELQTEVLKALHSAICAMLEDEFQVIIEEDVAACHVVIDGVMHEISVKVSKQMEEFIGNVPEVPLDIKI